jgi:sarcosine oxidase subunit delta
MLLIDCPYCGTRPEIEFTHGGQAHLARPSGAASVDDTAWTEFLYMRANTKGIHAERWRHAHGCGRFFNALRDTTTDHFLAFYKTGQPRPPLSAVAGETRPELSVAAGNSRPELSVAAGNSRLYLSGAAGEPRPPLSAIAGELRPDLGVAASDPPPELSVRAVAAAPTLTAPQGTT